MRILIGILIVVVLFLLGLNIYQDHKEKKRKMSPKYGGLYEAYRKDHPSKKGDTKHDKEIEK